MKTAVHQHSNTMNTPMDGDDWLEVAHEAWHYIDSLSLKGQPSWQLEPGAPEKPNFAMYNGSGGILVFLIELMAATNSKQWHDRVVNEGDAILDWIKDRETMSCNTPLGWGGYTFVLSCLASYTGEQRFRDAASRCVVKLRESAQPLGSGLGWIERMPFSDITGISDDAEVVDLSVGSAGSLLTLLHGYVEGFDPLALDAAKGVGDRLIEVARKTPDGLLWFMAKDMPFEFPSPNFAHGSSGVAFALTELAAISGESRFLDAAIQGMEYTLSRAAPQAAGGSLICHLETEPDRYYLGTCHGPPGTGRGLLRLYDVTGDKRWLDKLYVLLDGLMGTGAPEARSAGLWRNFGQCCGDAGIGDFSLLLARRGLWDPGFEYAERCASHILAESEYADGGRSWSMAEHRNRPEFLQRQTGYMQGAAGIGSFMVHIGSQANGKPVGLYPLDWPRTDPKRVGDPFAAGA